MSFTAILALGFLLGMRHATDADHVVAVSTIVARARSFRAAAPVGVLWGIGHTMTILVFGGLIVVSGAVIPPRAGLAMEFSVALMLVVLGALNVRAGFLKAASDDVPGALKKVPALRRLPASLRPLLVGVVHGLAGSAAVALLVLGAIREPAWAMVYLAVFGVGTIAGMLLITLALALPVAAVAHRFERFHRALGVATGLAGVALGLVLAFRIGVVDDLFGANPHWDPH